MLSCASWCLFDTFREGNSGKNPLSVWLNSSSRGGICVVEWELMCHISKRHCNACLHDFSFLQWQSEQVS